MPRSAALKQEQVSGDSKPTLDAFTKNLGFTPNMLATFAQSPIAFNAWANLRSALNRALDLKTREIISLAVSEVNDYDYCLAVHSYAANMAKLPADQIILARKGRSSDAKRDAAVQFARKVIEVRGSRAGQRRRSENRPRSRLRGCKHYRDCRAGGRVLPDELFQ